MKKLWILMLGVLTLGPNLAHANQVAGKRISVVVGCKLPKFDALNYTLIDAQMMAERIGPGGDCKLLLSDAAQKPTKAAVMAAIQSQAAKCGPNDTFWFYWSGHGDKLKDTSYLLNYDCNPFDVRTMISVTEVRNLIKSCKARAKVVVLDACHSGSTKAAFGKAFDSAIATFRGQATLAACQLDQTALELPELGHGLFTFFLVRGLAGEAAEGSGSITLASLKKYTTEQVSGFAKARGHKQDPQFIFDEAQGSQPVATASPNSEQPPVPQNTTVQPMRPLPPGVVVFIEGQNAAAAVSLQTKIKKRLIGHGLPVLSDESASAFQQLLQQSAGSPNEAMEQWRSRFLVRATLGVEVTTNPDLATALTATVTISGELIDADGGAKTAFETVVPGIGSSATTATNRALDKALEKFYSELESKLDELMKR